MIFDSMILDTDVIIAAIRSSSGASAEIVRRARADVTAAQEIMNRSRGETPSAQDQLCSP
jgi:hypothetical protein